MTGPELRDWLDELEDTIKRLRRESPPWARHIEDALAALAHAVLDAQQKIRERR